MYLAHPETGSREPGLAARLQPSFLVNNWKKRGRDPALFVTNLQLRSIRSNLNFKLYGILFSERQSARSEVMGYICYWIHVCICSLGLTGVSTYCMYCTEICLTNYYFISSTLYTAAICWYCTILLLENKCALTCKQFLFLAVMFIFNLHFAFSLIRSYGYF